MCVTSVNFILRLSQSTVCLRIRSYQRQIANGKAWSIMVVYSRDVREQIFRTKSPLPPPLQWFHSHGHSHLKHKSHSHFLPSSNFIFPPIPIRKVNRDVWVFVKNFSAGSMPLLTIYRVPTVLDKFKERKRTNEWMNWQFESNKFSVNSTEW